MDIKLNEPWIKNKIRCQNGYVYIDTGFWNKEKKCADHKREYIGTYDGKTFTPNKTFQRLKEEHSRNATQAKRGPAPAEKCLRQFYGATYLLNQIAYKTGIKSDLNKCFGTLASQILSIAYYLILEEGQPLYRFSKWGITHKHPFAGDIPSQRSSEIFEKR